ncbi:MAG: zinc ribbon domain-containing protein [Chloroflexi bacterium]|nr:zinc ribbon domain-containing protein [Chloroflexota bacterium]
MPLYEFRCDACGQVTTVFTRSIGAPVEPVCSACGGRALRRALSTFAIGKTVQQVHEAAGPTPRYPDNDFYSDPRNIGRNVEETFARHGMELPEKVRETIDAARDGAPPGGLDL